MLFDIIFLILSFILLVYSSLLLNKLTNNILVALLYGAYISVFTVFVPIIYLSGYHFISIPESYIDNLQIYNIGSFAYILTSVIVFLCFQSVHKNPLTILPRNMRLFDIKKSRFYIITIFFFLVSYLSLAHEYDSIFYPLEIINQFKIVQKQKIGGWFFVVLSGSYVYPFLIMLYYYSKERISFVWPFCLTIIYVLISVTVFKVSDRTTFIVFIILAILSRRENFSVKLNAKLIPLVSILSFLGLYILLVGNAWRMGDFTLLPTRKLLENLTPAVLINFLQVENSLALIQYFRIHSFYGYNILMLVSSGYAMLPSVLLPFHKINTGLEQILTLKIFGENLPAMYSKNSTLTFSIPFTGYAEGGYIGLIVASFIYNIILSIVAVISARTKGFSKIYFYYMLIFLIFAYRLSAEASILTLYIGLFYYFLMTIIAKVKT